jgi:streptogramin lyase
MRPGSLTLIVSATLAFALTPVSAQQPAALNGQVTSAQEGPMEGVLVSAKQSGIAVTVVSDRQGHYSFPAARLAQGEYAVEIRAAGYEIDRTKVTLPANKTATLDLKLRKTEDLASQLSNGEWLLSAPGTEEQKKQLLACVGCHTLEHPFKSKFSADEFMDVLQRMTTYANQSTWLRPQKRLAERLMEERGDQRVQVQKQLAEYLSRVNLSASPEWSYPLKTLPRPSGRGTRVIVTEYDLPRPDIEPHDVIVTADGMVWYSNFGQQDFGRLDPKTGEVKEYALPELKPGWPTGSLSIRADADGNVWLGMMYQGAISRFDRKTEQLQTWSVPDTRNPNGTQINMTSPFHAKVDGKIWAQNNGFAGVHRLDLASGKWETWEPFANAPKGEPHNIYDVIADSRNNAYFTDFAQGHIGRIDAKTGELKLYATPTPRSAPRRGMMDGQDRLWFAEYRGNKVAMFDTKTEKFQEWEPPTPWSQPYDVALDKNGEAWTGSMLTDRILRLDPKTGQFVEYLMPNEMNIRRVFVDNSTTPVTFWVGSNHGGTIVKVEPLD